MKNLKVETSRDFGDRSPSKSFFRELSGQLTPKIADLIESEHLRESLPELICISLDSASYTEFTESDGSEFLNMRISAFSAPLIICDFIVRWESDNADTVHPWDDLNGRTVRFDFFISEYNIKRLNCTVRQLYHPVIETEQSGLPFDYQIYYGGESLTVDFRLPTADDETEEIRTLTKNFTEAWNESHELKIHVLEVKKISGSKVRCDVDFGGCGVDAVEAMIFSFRCRENIKKITCL